VMYDARLLLLRGVRAEGPVFVVAETGEVFEPRRPRSPHPRPPPLCTPESEGRSSRSGGASARPGVRAPTVGSASRHQSPERAVVNEMAASRLAGRGPADRPGGEPLTDHDAPPASAWGSAKSKDASSGGGGAGRVADASPGYRARSFDPLCSSARRAVRRRSSASTRERGPRGPPTRATGKVRSRPIGAHESSLRAWEERPGPRAGRPAVFDDSRRVLPAS